MKENDGDSQLSDLMTSYLQHFKATTAVKLSLIEALCLQGNSLQCNPQFLLSKFSTRSYVHEWKIDPSTIMLNLDYGIIINKFYVGIHQYLEFRLKTISDVGDGIFLEQIQTFHKELYHIVKKAQSTDKSITNLAQFFLEMNNAQDHFIQSLLQKFQEKKVNRPRRLIDDQFIEEIKIFIREKINKQQNQGLRENSVINHRSILKDNKISLSSKTDENLKPKGWILRKMHHKKEASPMNIILQPLQPLPYKAQWPINSSHCQMGDESVELQAYVVQTNKNKLKIVYSLLDADESSFNVRAKNDLEVELNQRNFKNKLIIQTFINKYQRKLRKKEQKDHNDRSARSTAKTSKEIPSRRQDTSIFQQKFDSVQYMSPFLKNTAEKFKRGGGILELPSISNRHYRRITLQK